MPFAASAARLLLVIPLVNFCFRTCYNSQVDVVAEIEHAFEHVMKKPRALKFDGQKFFRERPNQDQIVQSAFALLKRRGVTKQSGFKDAWKVQLTLLGFS